MLSWYSVDLTWCRSYSRVVADKLFCIRTWVGSGIIRSIASIGDGIPAEQLVQAVFYSQHWYLSSSWTPQFRWCCEFTCEANVSDLCCVKKIGVTGNAYRLLLLISLFVTEFLMSAWHGFWKGPRGDCKLDCVTTQSTSLDHVVKPLFDILIPFSVTLKLSSKVRLC